MMSEGLRGIPVPQIIRMRGIRKSFGSVPVLRGVDLEIAPGEVHVLAGENGAGKSTLIKILAGAHQDFEGEIEIGGQQVRPSSPRESVALGVAVVYQELSLAPNMSVADNLFLGHPIERCGFVDDATQQRMASACLAQLGLDIDVRKTVESFPIATQQVIEIARAVSREARVIVMDEPTSALSIPEVEYLFALIARLKAQGRSIVYITHKMDEIGRIADQITVLRDGEFVGSAPAEKLPSAKLIEWIVGRKTNISVARTSGRLGPERLRLERFSVAHKDVLGTRVVDRVSVSVRAGEILGIAGLRGSGASELLLGVFGACGDRTDGEVFLDGRRVRHRSPRDAVRHGIAMATNDRKSTGLVLSSSIIANLTLVDLPRLSPSGWRTPAKERVVASGLAAMLHLRAASLDLEVGQLSGGNQQKVVLGKWIQTEPRIFLLDEPTRGIDIGAKHEIYQLMGEWSARGMAIVLTTTELSELVALSDRVVVMHQGRAVAEFSRPEMSAHAILEAAMGGRNGDPAR